VDKPASGRTSDESGQHDRNGVVVDRASTLERALVMLEWLADREHGGHSIRAIASATGLSKTTVHRLLESLARRGWVTQTDGERYELGFTALRVGAAVIRHLDDIPAIRPVANALRDATDETVFTTVLDADRLLIVDKFESASAIRFASPVGARSLPHANAAGKALLAHLTAEQLDAYLDRPLDASTPKTVTDPELLRAQLAEIRECGYAVVDEESIVGVFSVGAVVTNYRGEVRAGLSVSGPRERMRSRQAEIEALVQQAAYEASRRLGT
jgi:DNA-binding IclR family transcriptional regulator